MPNKSPTLTTQIQTPSGSAAMRAIVRSAATIVIAMLVYFGLCAALWRSGARGGDAYVVVPKAIDSTRAPAWLPPAEIARVNALGNVVRGRSILDPDLTHDLAACYMESPWVERVLHIRRAYPNRLDVALVIRKPFAAVRRPSGPSVVLDRFGMRLPVSATITGLPLLEGIASSSPAPGRRWEDVRVLDALRVLERYRGLTDELDDRGLRAAKVVVKKWSRPDARPVVELITSKGFPIVWGVDLPNGEATITGPSADEKLLRLSKALPALARQSRQIAYLSVKQRTGLVLKYRDEGAGIR